MPRSRFFVIAVAALCGAGVVPALVATSGASAAASPTPSTTSYTPGPASLATIANGTSAAPWNLEQGDSGSPAYASVSPGTVLPTYTPGGATTGSGANAEPNLAVYPGASSGTDGTSPYPSGTAGTPGPLDGYCGTGDNTAETGTARVPVRQPDSTTLPLGPAYFPHVVRNSDGSLTGYFDYRPKDADEAIEAARSTDNGQSWTFQAEALEQNAGVCANADINDDGEGHPNVLTINGVSRLYTLQRPAGDNAGVGMLVHPLTPTPDNPLAGVPASEKVGIDPDDFASGPPSGGVIPLVNPVGTGPDALQAGGFVDLTATAVPTASSVITCTGVSASALSGCSGGAVASVTTGDLIEQVIGTVGTNTDVTSNPSSIPAGPNTTTGDGGVVVGVNYATQVTATILNANAPNRVYVDGVAVYCAQSDANPTDDIENCTTGPNGHSLPIAANDPVTSDPIVPATATPTSGLVSPDGIVGVVPSYPNDGSVSSGATYVMYTEKILNYFVAGVGPGGKPTFGSAKTPTQPFTVSFTPSVSEPQDMPTPATVSAAHPVTVSIGDTSKPSIVPVTCTGLTQGSGATMTLSGCTVPAANIGDSYNKNSLIGAPGATTVDNATLNKLGEGVSSPPSAKNIAKLFKNNEDLTRLRVAYTTDGITFSSSGLANSGVISGASDGASSYTDINNPSSTTNPALGLNAYGNPGTQDATEMRWVGSAGTILTNPDESYGMFLSGAWAADGDSDAFNQIFYTTSTDGEHWSEPVLVVSTDYTFSASVAQDSALASGHDDPLGISAYYSGRAYGPSVVEDADGSLTMVFAGYRLPKPIVSAGTVLGTGAQQYTVGASDPALYRNILTMQLTSATSPLAASSTAVTSSDGQTGSPGASVTYTATLSPSADDGVNPSGSVAFSDTNGPIAACQNQPLSISSPDTATCTTDEPDAAGNDSVTATYGGDTNYASSSGGLVEHIVASTTTVVGSSDGGSGVVGIPVTYTASVTVNSPGLGVPAGTVTFADGGTSISGCTSITLNTATEQATCAVTYTATATHQITATYSGSPDFLTSTSLAVAEKVVATN